MKTAQFRELEAQLINLPYDQKQQLKNRLSDLIESQEESIIDTTPTSLSCRHCDHESIKKWGKSQGLQLYKCRNEGCGKTFNMLTGTPLARLRHKHKWLDSLVCMQDNLPLRVVAKKLDIDLTTAFRWRHRFLEIPAKNQSEQVTGIVEADETLFRESLKGQRNIHHRNARKRGGQGGINRKENKVPVLIVRSRDGQVRDFVFEELSQKNISQSLKPILAKDAILCTDGSSLYKAFTKKENISHYRLITLDNQRVIGKEFHIQNVNAYMSKLKTWIRKFNGVGTRYLPHYLGWKRLFEGDKLSQTEWLKLAIRI